MLSVATRVERGSAGEDRLLVEREADRTIVIVADGAGGSGSGGLAADLLCTQAIGLMRGPGCDALERSRQALLSVDHLLFTQARGGQAAAVVLEISHFDRTVRGAGVGDVGAWLIGSSGIVDLTERQIAKPLLGSGEVTPVAFGPIALDGRLLVATDGLFKYASIAEIDARARHDDLEDAASALVAGARLRSGRLPDDVAVVLCERTGQLTP